MKSDYLDKLERAIRVAHGWDPAEHVESVRVTHRVRKRVVWQGDVEVFRSVGHTGVSFVYAWGYPYLGKLRCFTMVKRPAVNSPEKGVKFALLKSKMPR